MSGRQGAGWAAAQPDAWVAEYSNPIAPGVAGLRKIKDSQIVALGTIVPRHPVFELTLINPPETLVIKSEMHGSDRYTQVAAVFNAATKNAVSQVLDASEIEALKALKCPKPPGVDQYWQQLFQMPNFWVKMPMVQGLKSTNGSNPVELVNLVTSMKGKEKVWTSLGKILAADLLTGNRDRIVRNNNTVRITNWGNLFFLLDQNQVMMKMVAIDNFDPSAALTGLTDAGQVQWMSDCAKYFDKTKAKPRDNFCTGVVNAIVADVQAKAGPALFGTVAAQMPGPQETQWLKQGLEAGFVKIARKVSGRVGFLPSKLLRERLACLNGW